MYFYAVVVIGLSESRTCKGRRFVSSCSSNNFPFRNPQMIVGRDLREQINSMKAFICKRKERRASEYTHG